MTTSLRSACSSLFGSLRTLTPIPSGPSSSRWASSYVQLHDLMPNPGSTRNNVRLGRGSSSTKGGTSGRGHKGQKARSGNGKPKAGFEGGQTPITRLFPKRGFVNFSAKEYVPLNIATLQEWLAMGRLDPAAPIDVGAIYQAKLAKGVQRWDGIKLLGDVDPLLPLPPLTLRLSRYSKSAARAILDAGGSLTAVYQNKLALKQAAHPEKFEGREVKEALPTQKRDIRFYSDAKNFGYLAKGVEAGKAEGMGEQSEAQ